jgi:hypothetical protein
MGRKVARGESGCSRGKAKQGFAQEDERMLGFN